MDDVDVRRYVQNDLREKIAVTLQEERIIQRFNSGKYFLGFSGSIGRSNSCVSGSCSG